MAIEGKNHFKKIFQPFQPYFSSLLADFYHARQKFFSGFFHRNRGKMPSNR